MKVVIIGGRGNIGQEVALGLIRQKEIDTIVLGDVNNDPAGLRDRLRKNGKVSLERIDAADHQSLAAILRGSGVVVNCAGPFHKTALAVARASVEAGAHYVDVCDEHAAVNGLFASEIDKSAREAGITALTGMGSDPGTNNLIAAWYARRLDRVDEVSLFWAVNISGLAGAAREHALHMTRGKIPQFLDGGLEYVVGGSGEESVLFPEPLGSCVVRYVGHPQPLTMPRSIEGVRNVVVKGALLPGHPDRLAGDRKIMEPMGAGPSVSGLKVIVKGERKGKRVTYMADMVGEMGAGTGLPASIAVWMLVAGEIDVRGLVAPEGCIDPEKFLSALLRGGARIHETEIVESLLDL
jgi:lysine 6-dehydrogenase